MEKTRCDKRSILVRTVKSMSLWCVVAAVFLCNMLFDGEMDTEGLLEAIGHSLFLTVGLFLGLVFLFVLVTALYQTLRWHKTLFWIENGTLYEERNLLFMKRKSVKLSAISTVNLQQNLLERVFRLYHLKLDFQSAATAEETDFDLIFDEKTAYIWKDLILRKEIKTPEVYDKIARENDPVEQFLKDESSGEADDLSGKKQKQSLQGRRYHILEVMRHCIFSLSITQIFMFLLSVTFVVCDFIFVEKGEGRNIEFIVFVIFLGASAVYSVIKKLLEYYGFSFTVTEHVYHLRYGLLTKHEFDMDTRKSGAIVLRQPFLCRIFGYAYGELIQVGLGNESSDGERPIFCLCMKKEECLRLIQEMIPDYQTDAEWIKMDWHSWYLIHPVYSLVVVIMTVLTLIANSFLEEDAIPVLFILLGMLVLLLLAVLKQFIRILSSGMSIQEHYLTVTNGHFGKTTHIIAYKNVQKMQLQHSFLARRQKIKNGNVVILASIFNRIINLPYVSEKQMEKLEKQILVHENRLILARNAK